MKLIKTLTQLPYLIITSLLLTACATATAANQNPLGHYTIVIDAGSSGSRLHIFEYVNKAADAKQLPLVKDIAPADSAITPGISSFAQHPQDVGPALKPLLDKANITLQAAGADLSRVDFNLLATAGMRLLPAASQAAIYQAIKDYLTANTRFKLKNIETISGKMEGVYDWLAVNYWQNNLQAEKIVTAGALDLGGASTQITYENPTAAANQDSYSFLLFNRVYVLSSNSFLGLGQDQARGTAASLACYPTGYQVAGLGVGAFNAPLCRKAITTVLAKHDFSKITTSIPASMQHVAFSGYYYTTHFFKAKNLTELATAATQVCASNWQDLQKHYPDVAQKYLANYCFNGLYVQMLLEDGYQFPEATQQIQFASKVNQQSIDWAVGVVVESMVKELTQTAVAH